MSAIATLFVAAVLPVTRIRRRWCNSFGSETLFDLSVAGCLYVGSSASIVPWWSLCTNLLCRWCQIPCLAHHPWLQPFVQGPLGMGSYKILHVGVAICLWRILHQEWPKIMWIGRHPPSISALLLLLVISVVAILVLYLWSRFSQSRGTHDGVYHLVQSSLNRSLTWNETVWYASLAVVNAVCEKVTSRWFWWQEFDALLFGNPISGTTTTTIIKATNLAQAMVFGFWHYHGIPSGIIGVALTFVYGMIMGLLKESVGGGGLVLPILTHSLADFYLFTNIARGKAAKRDGRSL